MENYNNGPIMFVYPTELLNEYVGSAKSQTPRNCKVPGVFFLLLVYTARLNPIPQLIGSPNTVCLLTHCSPLPGVPEDVC